jgi:DNA-binding NarL/FixJ family response regulator
MSLTERERVILHFKTQGLSDYKIARKINSNPSSITRSRQNARKKLEKAQIDLQYARQIGIAKN